MECISESNKYISTEIIKEDYSSIDFEIFNFTHLTEMETYVKNVKIRNKLQDILKIEKNITKENGNEEEIEYYDTILENVENIFTSENFDTIDIDNGKDEIIETEKMTITFTTSENQKNNNLNDNLTSIDLGECETLLRNYYNLSENETLYMKKIDILNLTICENSKISLSIPIIITENIDELNISSEYYNDICYTTTSESGTDISLKDKQKEFVNGNKTVCQEECDFSDYDIDSQKAKCSCNVKESSSSIIDMNIDKEKLYLKIWQI